MASEVSRQMGENKTSPLVATLTSKSCLAARSNRSFAVASPLKRVASTSCTATTCSVPEIPLRSADGTAGVGKADAEVSSFGLHTVGCKAGGGYNDRDWSIRAVRPKHAFRSLFQCYNTLLEDLFQSCGEDVAKIC